MIKGGGGALLKEKVIMSAAKRVVIARQIRINLWMYLTSRFRVEVHQFARSIVSIKLKEEGGIPKLRTIEKGYPFITENGNIILDTTFNLLMDVRKKELELKNIPGCTGSGLFTKVADIYYKAKIDGSFETIQF